MIKSVKKRASFLNSIFQPSAAKHSKISVRSGFSEGLQKQAMNFYSSGGYTQRKLQERDIQYFETKIPKINQQYDLLRARQKKEIPFAFLVGIFGFAIGSFIWFVYNYKTKPLNSRKHTDNFSFLMESTGEIAAFGVGILFGIDMLSNLQRSIITGITKRAVINTIPFYGMLLSLYWMEKMDLKAGFPMLIIMGGFILEAMIPKISKRIPQWLLLNLRIFGLLGWLSIFTLTYAQYYMMISKANEIEFTQTYEEKNKYHGQSLTKLENDKIRLEKELSNPLL